MCVAINFFSFIILINSCPTIQLNNNDSNCLNKKYVLDKSK